MMRVHHPGYAFGRMAPLESRARLGPFTGYSMGLERVCECDESDWLFACIKGIGCPLWICDLRGNVRFVNERAEKLLGCTAQEWRGAACHHLVAGKSRAGQAVCRAECEIRRRAREGREIEPVALRVGGPNRRPWAWMLTFVPTPPAGVERVLVHCALDVDRMVRAEEYLNRVASRSDPLAIKNVFAIAILSKREREILNLLAADEDSFRIAKHLFLSHATVRNHIQHILEKLDVHSIEEAVARRLLERDS